MKTYKTLATDKVTGEKEFIEIEAKTKKEFNTKARELGYSINEIEVKEKDVYDYILDNTEAYTWHFQKIKKVGDSTNWRDYYKDITDFTLNAKEY